MDRCAPAKTGGDAAVRVTTLAIVVALCRAGGLLHAAEPATFTDLLRKAHAYVVVYEDHELSSVIARERYHQQLIDRYGTVTGERTMLSDYLIFQLPPDEDWFALRDTLEVDGTSVDDRATRLGGLFTGTREEVAGRVMEISKENARFNLGDVYRTINVPTFALRFLRPLNRARFVFEAAGEEAIDGTNTAIVAYREIKEPTFSVTTDGRNIPAHGRFWIEPDTGIVVRSEMILGGTRRVRDRATVTVTYGLEPSLGFRVPVAMQERYDDPRKKKSNIIVAEAAYSSFRRFDWRDVVRPQLVPDEATAPAETDGKR